MAPKLAAFDDEITQNEKLFARIAAVYDARATRRGSRPSSSGWPGCYYTNFVRAGAKLDAGGEEAAVARSTSASPTLYTKFSQNVLADEDDYVLVLEKRGRPRRPARFGARRRAAAAAEERGTKGKWAIAQHALVRSTRS